MKDSHIVKLPTNRWEGRSLQKRDFPDVRTLTNQLVVVRVTDRTAHGLVNLRKCSIENLG